MDERINDPEGAGLPDDASDALLMAAFRAREDRNERRRTTRSERRGGEEDSRGPLTVQIEASGRYQILGEIGRGGVGVVYRGLDRDLGRELAIKTLVGRRDDAALRRFLDEARICSQLQHPSIVPIYELVGEDGDAPFFTMRLVDGRHLGDLFAARSEVGDDREHLLGIVLQACHAVAYGHARGVVHRDLKPANIMAGSFGEVQVLDWGLAKAIGSAESAESGDETSEEPPGPEPVRAGSAGPRSLAGSVTGTPSYMAPEQARGEPSAVDPRADVFSLGAILCELLTGLPPFVGDGASAVRRLAARAALQPAHDRLTECAGPRDLVELVRDCLAEDSDQRPADAREVAARIAEHVASAQRSAEEARRAAVAAEARAEEAAARVAAERRAKRTTAGMLIALLALVIGGGAGWRWMDGARRERMRETRLLVDEALDGAVALEARGDLASWTAALADVDRAEAAAASGEADAPLLARIAERRTAAEGGLEAAQDVEAQRAADRRLVERLELAREDATSILTVRMLHEGYAQAFADYGIDLEALDEETALERIRASAVRETLIDALDHWAVFGGRAGQPDLAAAQARASSLAGAVDDEGLRSAIRLAIRERDLDELRRLADDVERLPAAPFAHWMLGEALIQLGDGGAAIQALKHGARRFPDGFWCHFTLGFLGPEVPGLEGHLAAAVAIRPGSPNAWTNLGIHHAGAGNVDDARHAFEEAVRLCPNRGPTFFNLWRFLREIGAHGEALDVAESWAIARPDDPRALLSKGEALQGLGREQAGLEVLEDALQRGNEVLVDEPDDPETLEIVARCQRGLQDEGAEETLVVLLELRPKHTWALHELGHVYLDQERYTEAIDSFRRALDLLPDHHEYLCDLGLSLLFDGRPREALEPMRRAQELGSLRPTGQYLEVIERHARYADLVEGVEEPGDVDEMLEAATTALELDDHVNAARFYAMAFDADLEASGTRQFEAACAAVRGAAGEGEGAPELTAGERSGLRDRAYTWLTRHLERIRTDAAAGQVPATWIDQMKEWRTEGALASVRDVESLAELPSEERARWETLWSGVDAFVAEFGD